MSAIRRTILGLVLIAVMGWRWGSAHAQNTDSTVPRVSFRFERSGVVVPRYTLTVMQSGALLYEGEELGPVEVQEASESGGQRNGPGAPFRIDARLSVATTKRVFSAAKSLRDFNVPCESHAKNIADTGKKTLQYAGPDGHGECTYNYSENKTVTQLTDTFLGIAETMDEGRRLDHLHRYDRLGMDAAITLLADQVNAGRALELGTIANTLRSIAGDTNLIQRVRLRASQLLSLLPPEMQQSQ